MVARTGRPEASRTRAGVDPAGTVSRSSAALEGVRAACRAGFELRRIRAAEADQWVVSDGALRHRSGGFFSVNGVSDGETEGVLLYQPQAAVTGVLTARVDGQRRFLLQARAEPGCVDEVQFGPTVQSTPANFLRLHGGVATPYVEAFIDFDPRISVLEDTTQLDLGERYLFKTKRSILLETEAPAAPRGIYIWATPEAVLDSVGRSAFLNIDLRSILSVSRWSHDADSGDLAPRAPLLRQGLQAPVRPDLLGDVIAALHRVRPAPKRFVPLASLANWRQTEWGWSEVVPVQGFSIDFFHLEAAFREVGAWAQPLVNSASEGHAVLACRERGGSLELCVRALPERGLATTSALAPTYLRYPGEPGEAPEWLRPPEAHVWSSTLESDEGGRFYRDASRYEIVRVDDARQPEVESGFWLRLSELKQLLCMSNLCTIQLRGIVSQLLGVTEL